VNAGRHALGWLVAGNAAGLWLSLLLLFPGLQAGEWTYGRWMPVHLNIQLFGWTSLPLVGWLLSIYGVSRRWSEAAVWAWTGALGAGVLSWLGGGSSGKIFLDWKGGPLFAFVAALSFLWVVLAMAWKRDASRWTPAKRWLSLAGLLLLAGVPWGMYLASSPDLYPPVDRSTGGPTGASLLGSTLVVVGLLLLLPRACGLEAKHPGMPWKTLGFFALSWVAFGVAESIGGTHSDALQIIALGLLLPWPWLVLTDWRNFRWPHKPHGWRVITLLWWGLLVITGFLAFLPDVLDRLKFTHGLVAHSHLAMAGFTTSFCALLLRLTGNRFGSLGSAIAWNIAAFTMIIVLAAAGWAEGANTAWMAETPAWRTTALALRTFCGLVMLAASVHWWWSWRRVSQAADAILESDETPRIALESGRRRDGRGDGIVADLRALAGDEAARDPRAPAGDAGPYGMDRRVRVLDRRVLCADDAGPQRGGDRVDLHHDRPQLGRRLSRRENRRRRSAGGMGAGGGGGRHGGGGPDDRPESGLVEGPGLGLAFRAAAVVAMVYAHFLIFAQFAWVELMRGAGGTAESEKIALGTMAAAGIAAGFVVARRNTGPFVLQLSFLVAGLSAALAPWASSMPFAIMISLLTGASIGTMTITLATLLPRWCGLAWTGLGTGLGYALCNLPPVFLATPAQQANAGVVFAVVGALLVPRRATGPVRPRAKPRSRGIVAVVLAFTALVWLDSAAFFIIQHERDLKSATWGEPMLWRNAAVHLAFAIAAGLLLRRRFNAVLGAAWAILAVAALAVNHADTRGLAGWWYPAGVSLYSTALVAWPGFFSTDPDPKLIARRAAWLYAVAGWFGSANGIGMVQSLHHVPAAFIAAAGLVIAGALYFGRARWPSAVALASVVALASAKPSAPKTKATPIERGRAVYLAEGCIHCHSRYVRPGSPDVEMWGPASDPAAVLAEKPVLIGNRRQGPDLANVGTRRSEAWLKLHFLQPRDFAAGSPMPSYAHLFRDTRGDDLIAFLRDVPAENMQARATAALTWIPSPKAAIPDGAPLYNHHCALCHGPVGHGDGKLAPLFAKRPANLDLGPFIWTPAGPDLETRVARVIKYGITGTDMPGHETLGDAELIALARYVCYLRGD
jgi:mono/diheme cytochrome c family protein/uncharacterized membrane protein YgcG